MENQYVRTGEDWKPVPLISGSFDPLTVFYAFRTHDLEVGKVLSVPVSDGKKCVMGLAKVLKKERAPYKNLWFVLAFETYPSHGKLITGFTCMK